MNLIRRTQQFLSANLSVEDALPTRMPAYVNSLAYLFGALMKTLSKRRNAVASRPPPNPWPRFQNLLRRIPFHRLKGFIVS